MRITRARVAAVVFLTLTVLEAAPSCGSTTGDRPAEAGGTQADAYKDAKHVTVYRNADNVPNVATFCIGTLGFASTLSGTDAAENKTAVLVRVPELDETCP